jgi:ParB-like chromosome segregation protein Spo0J
VEDVLLEHRRRRAARLVRASTVVEIIRACTADEDRRRATNSE